ncbi:AraC-type DNA-binding protein [Sphingobium faniae]|nr:AraC-type DNA-binding protein [Sphingobium faniae]
MTVRVQAIPSRTYFPDHAHEWGQVVYAISGVLAVSITGQSFAISPQQAVWLPLGVKHRVGSLMGAEFRSLWIARDWIDSLPREPALFGVDPLLKALIIEAARFEADENDAGYAARVYRLILDQLQRAEPIPSALPWPAGEKLTQLCEALYADPADPRSSEDWASELGMSSRTLTRRFEAEVGMSLRSWRRRVRLFKAIEMLGGGMDVTQTAMALGYASTSAFIYAFRTEMGEPPQLYMRPRKVAR